MTDLLPPDVHREALLLPWFLSGTLPPSEQQEVTDHLGACATCGAELAALAHDRRLVRAILAAMPAGASDLHPAIVRLIERESGGSWAASGSAHRPRAASDLRNRIGWRVGMALAASIIAAQLVVIADLARGPKQPPSVGTRSLESPTTRLRLTVDPDARAGALDELLRDLRARVVDGPTADGTLIVEVATTDPEAIVEKLARARANPSLIRDADVLPR